MQWRLLLVGVVGTVVACDSGDTAEPVIAPRPSEPRQIVPPVNPPKLTIAATYPCLYAAIRDRDYHGHPTPRPLIPIDEIHRFRNPATGRLLELDTSAGGGYACCEAPTFYPQVDRHDSVFWIKDRQASMKRVHEAWYGPFALCPQPPCTCPTPPNVALAKIEGKPAGIDLTVARELVERALPGIESCYSFRVRSRPTLGGAIDLKLLLLHNPVRVDTVTPINGALPYDQLVGCAKGSLTGPLQLPSQTNGKAAPKLSPTELTVTLSFTPPSTPLKPIGDAIPTQLESSDLETLRTSGTRKVPIDPATEAIRKAGKRLTSVLFELCVSLDGRPTSTRVHRSSGSTSFDRLVEKTARSWRFAPILIDREPTAVCVGYSVAPGS